MNVEWQCIVVVECQIDEDVKCQSFQMLSVLFFCMWFHESTNARKTRFLGFVKRGDKEHDKMDELESKETIFLSYIQDGFKVTFVEDLKHTKSWFND